MKKNIHTTLQLVTASLAFMGVACEADVAGSAPADEASKVTTTNNSTNSESEMDLTLQVAIAVTDVAERTGVAEDAVQVQEARVVNWGSSAIGCPKEGMNYMQVIVPGVLLLLRADRKTFRYHGETGREPFYCPDDRAQAPAYGQGKEFM